MALPFRLFAGGRLGDGRQWFPWIHLDDLVRVYRLAIDDESLSGPVVAVAPQLLRQRDAARDFGAVLHRPSRVPTPAPVLRAALGEQADLLLHGQRAVSRRLNGFEFRYRALRARSRRRCDRGRRGARPAVAAPGRAVGRADALARPLLPALAGRSRRARAAAAARPSTSTRTAARRGSASCRST